METSDILNRFEDLAFPLEVEFGNLELSIREILALKPGIVLKTSHSAQASLTLRAGESSIASVETQVIDDALSVRVQSILEPLGKPGNGAAAPPQAR